MNIGDKDSQVQRIEISILEYLVANPDARDTYEGIVEWWLLEQEIEYRSRRVKMAIDNLVRKGLLLSQKGADSRIHYGINKQKYDQIEQLIRQESPGERRNGNGSCF